MIHLKRVAPQLCAILIVCILAGVGYIQKSVFSNTSGSLSRTVILDAGHPELA